MKNLIGTDEIVDYVKGLVSSDKFGDKIIIARMYGSFEREGEEIYKKDSIIDTFGLRNIEDVIIFSEEIIVVKYFSKFDETYKYNIIVKGEKIFSNYNSYEEAIISALAYKNNKGEYLPAIMNLLGIK